MVARALECEARGRHAVTEAMRVLTDAIHVLGRLAEHLKDLERRTHDRRTERVGEQVRTRTLAKDVDHFLATRGVATGAATERLAERRVDDVDTALDTTVFVTATPRGAEEARGVALVDEDLRVVLVGEVADGLERRDITVHTEDAVGDDQTRAAVLGFLELGLQVGEIHVLEAVALGLAQPHAVDDGRVVEFVRDDGVLLTQRGFKETGVGVKARRVEDRVFRAVKVRDDLFQLLVDVLRAADEAHGAESKAVRVERLLGGLDDRRVVAQPQVVVGAEVEHAGAVDRDLGALGRRDDALALVRAGGVDGRELVAQAVDQHVALGGKAPRAAQRRQLSRTQHEEAREEISSSTNGRPNFK